MGRLWRFLWLLAAWSLLLGCTAQPFAKSARHTQPETQPPSSAETLQFPYTLPGGVVAEQVLPYCGPYWEDESGTQAENVAALVIYNPTDQMLIFGAFALEQDGQQLYFFLHRLPPKSRCLVLEFDKKSCEASRVTDCRLLQIRWGYPDFSQEQVDYVCLGPEMTLISRDARTLSLATVWYKRYDRTEDCYLGGIAYAAYFPNMLPAEGRTLLPEHYDAAYVRIVGIEVEI